MYVNHQQGTTRATTETKGWPARFNFCHPRLRLCGALFALLLVILWGIAFWTAPLFAAMRLNYFDVLVNAEQVTLEWSTASENEVLSFEVECKKEEEPNSQYHLIGERLAQGNKDHGAIYRFDIIDGLEANTSYCFRLREITLNHEQGEIIDRCGYGLNITPNPATTPTETVELTTTTTISITPVISPVISLVISPTLEATATIEQPLFVTATPLLAETATPTVTTVDAQSLPGQITPTDIPTIPTATATPFVESPLIPPITPTTDVPSDNNQTSAAALSAVASTDFVSATASISQPEAVNTAAALANPPYIILTVTPTDATLAVASTFTPFPTAAIDTEPNLVAATLPSTQNLMILLLCGVFSGASGLGVLGLVTTLLYMRSRTVEQKPTRKQ